MHHQPRCTLEGAQSLSRASLGLFSQGVPVNHVLHAQVDGQGAITDMPGIDEVAQRLRVIYERSTPINGQIVDTEGE